MNDLISRQAAIDAINEYELNAPEYMQEYVCKLIEAVKFDIVGLISELPSAEKRGEWLKYPGEVVSDDGLWGETLFDCSNCGHTVHVATMFCSQCGARMVSVKWRSEDATD